MKQTDSLLTWPARDPQREHFATALADSLRVRTRSRRFWLHLLVMTALLIAYTALLFVPLPYGDTAAISGALQYAWWPWQAFDIILSGGALGRLSIVLAGGVAALAARNQDGLRPAMVHRHLGTAIFGALIYIAAPTLIVFAVLIALGYLPSDARAILANGGLLLAGSLFVVILHQQLEQKLGANVFVLNGLLVLSAYLAQVGQRGDIVSLFLIGAAVVLVGTGFLLSQRRTERVLVVDRQSGLNEKANVIVPYSNPRLEYTLLVFWCGLATILLLPISFFGRLPMDLGDQTWMVLAALVGAALLLWLFVKRYKVLSSSFSPDAAANYLHSNLWIAPAIRPGRETAEHLATRIVHITGFWLMFFTVAYGVLWAGAATAVRLQFQVAPFPGGMIGLLITIVLGGFGLLAFVERVRAETHYDHQAGQLPSMHFMSEGSTIDLHATKEMIQAFPLPDDLRDKLLEVLTLIAERPQIGTAAVAMQTLVAMLKPLPVQEASERLEILERGLYRSLLFELGTILLYTAGLLLILLVILNAFGYSFNNLRLELLLIGIPAAYNVLTSGRLWLTSRMIFERYQNRLRLLSNRREYDE